MTRVSLATREKILAETLVKARFHYERGKEHSFFLGIVLVDFLEGKKTVTGAYAVEVLRKLRAN